MHLILKGLELEIVDMMSSFPHCPWCQEVPAGPQEAFPHADLPPSKKHSFPSLALKNKSYSEPLTFSHVRTVKCASEMTQRLPFVFKLTSLLHTQIFITRLPSIFYNCTILKIISQPFFAFSDVRFLKIFSKIFESKF